MPSGSAPLASLRRRPLPNCGYNILETNNMTFAITLLIVLLIGSTVQFWFKSAIVGIILGFHLLIHLNPYAGVRSFHSGITPSLLRFHPRRPINF
jgi:hypothetical protein